MLLVYIPYVFIRQVYIPQINLLQVHIPQVYIPQVGDLLLCRMRATVNGPGSPCFMLFVKLDLESLMASQQFTA